MLVGRRQVSLFSHDIDKYYKLNVKQAWLFLLSRRGVFVGNQPLMVGREV